MRHSVVVLFLLLASATASLAQTGFTTKIYPAAGDTSLRVTDFNHDGKPDLLGYSTYFNLGNIYLNDGNGGFMPPVALPQYNTGAMISAKIADMNGDGFPDIVGCTGLFTRSATSYHLVIYQNDGNGNFTIAQDSPLAYGCNSLVVGDVNLDGHPDVVVASYTNTSSTSTSVNSFQTFFGDGKGKVGTPITQLNVDLDSPDSSNSFTNCGVVDITGGNFFLDGQFSLIANTQCKPAGQNNPGNLGTTFLGHGYGAGHYTFSLSRRAYEFLTDGQTVDVNEDNKPDATFYSVPGLFYSDLYYVQNNGGGTFTYNQLTGDISGGGEPAPVQFTGVAVADLTGDGINDIASIFTTANPTTSPTNPPYISILAGSNSGAFVESQHWIVDPNATGVADMVSADFNGDGKPDLAALVQKGPYPNYVTSIYVYTNHVASNRGCSAPTQTNTNIICQPANGSTASASPVTVTAASNVTGFTLNRLYLDNTSVYQTTSQIINTPITAANGSHRLVLVSYDKFGTAFSTSSIFTIGTTTTGSCIPSSASVSICAPTAGSTDSSPVTITAGALAQSGNITAIRAYIDNVAVLTVNNPSATKSFQISQAVAASAGTHRLVVIGYQSTGGSLVSAENFTVSPNTACYPATAGAMICSPAKNATTTSPVSIVAGATAAAGYITAIRVYVDNVAQALITNPQHSKSFPISTKISMTAGSHGIVVVGYQSTGGSVSASDTVKVQ